jgi:TPR repeat protein
MAGEPRGEWGRSEDPAARTCAPGPLACFLASLLVLIACNRHHPSAGEPSAPSASVITIGVVVGTCNDLDACERECDAGSADRCRRLAATYALAEGVPKDEARATALYERACDMNDASACVFAGQMHEYAHGVRKDDAVASRFYARACDLGWAAGCYNLAIMFELGRGVREDRAKAADRYRIACAAGATVACGKAKQMDVPGPAPAVDGGPP